MYHLTDGLEDKTGTASNLYGFIHRGLDTGFKTKWHGYWSPPYKYLDYYAYQINGIWLDSNTLKAVEYGENIKYIHELYSLTIIEHVKLEKGLKGFKSVIEIENNSDKKKAVQASVEAGIDIRKKSEDITQEKYHVENSEKNTVVTSGDKKLVISADQKIFNKGEAYTKEHCPGEPQKCFIPGQLVLRSEVDGNSTNKIQLTFKTSEKDGRGLNQREQSLKGLDIARCFNSSINSVKNLVYDNEGLGIIAGHPWFQNYWARDCFWTLLGFIDAGYYEESFEILENFAEYGIPGKINLEDSNDVMGRPDTAPLFIIAAEKLKRHYKTSEKILQGMEDAYDRLELEKNLVVHEPAGTWMDTLERPNAVDIQSLWLKADRIMEKDVEKLEKGLEEFVENGHVRDHLGDDAPHTINPAVPIMFGQLESEYLSKINGEFSSRFGARTRAVTDPGYDSSGYHKGSAWGLTTSWAAIANFENGKVREGLNFLENLAQFLDDGQPGALPEIVDSETGENLGCLEQAWSAGLFIHAVDSHLLGIKITEDAVKIDPAGDISCKRLGKRVGDSELDLEFQDGEVKILNDPDLDRKVIT